MKAAIRRSYGSPDAIRIEDIEKPIPNENQLLIKVHACTVNRTDCAILSAKPFIMRFLLGLLRPRKIILGTDFAGEVVSVGANVRSFSMGDGVYGFNDSGLGSQAEYTLTTIDNLFPIPEEVGYHQAAASLEGAHYAYTFIHKVNIQSGQKVLINGATGGIGSALLQFVRQFDVEITATCNTKNIELVRSLGADKICDYTQEDFTKGGDTYDFIFDTVGKSTFGKCKSLLKENGIYISSELGPYSQNVFYPLLTSFSGKKVIFPIPYPVRETIPYIRNLLKSGKFKPVIDRSYVLEDIGQAYEYVRQGLKTGNVLIDVVPNKQ
ncbi:NADPH:quinone reductase-like Zn-dependent oxidoreductase [Dyadobacter jejuensis]|uniref:NADPH:quinone reductase-like Zn-dependent oxidoreductase n=1 Tax=Dyadobacter jejuensis TaxID=1082580 RepID=A0A316AMP5_9BACT|nr:NAD(P)-dependent alcohol dehydrogenase [Dyadobacter jejuensis]PWJ58060.1 NADPH:quinone reductase-like Zn-dependent oxidoreductase [Dyadobacter jejuensis]